jgi:hypothetical protein
MSARPAVRLALGVLVVSGLFVGVWAAVAPRSFFLDFPGLGHTWTAADGPYNEHLVRDVGELNLALSVLTACALAWMTRPLVVAASGAWLVYSLPHFAYHAFNLGAVNGTGDQVAELASLSTPILLAGLALAAVARRDLAAAPTRAGRWTGRAS